MAAGAVGGSGAPELPDAVDDRLPWRLEVLGLLSIGAARVWRAAAGGMATRVVPPLCVTLDGSPILPAMPWASRMLPWPVGEGNWVSLKSVEADSRLLWRSSKLTEGRKSYEPMGSITSSDARLAPFLPKENREWLLADDALSIGAASEGRCAVEACFAGLALPLPLERRAETLAGEAPTRKTDVVLRPGGRGMPTWWGTGSPVWGRIPSWTP